MGNAERSKTARAIGLTIAYLAWMGAARLIVVTLSTYFLAATQGRIPSLDDISETADSSQLLVAAAAATSFVWLGKLLYPISTITWEEIVTPARLERAFLPGFLRGSALAAGVASAFLLGGYYRYLGTYVQLDEIPLFAASLVGRTLAIFALAYSEEFLFRQRILGYLRHQFPPWACGLVVAGAWTLAKAIQFDLGLAQLATLGILAFALTLRAYATLDFARGAGILAGLLVVFQVFLSLPVFGGDFAGILLVKHQRIPDPASFSRFLTGGAGGPFSSAILFGLFASDALRSIWLNRAPKAR